MVLIYAVEFLDIIPDSAKADPDIAAIAQMVAAYDALAPKPDAWPDSVQWYAIDSDGACNWHETEPTPCDSCWESGTAEWAGVVLIPIGLDWRLCKWQRPEVTR